MVIAGIILFGVIGNSLASTLREEEQHEPALTVFRTTTPGLNAWDIGPVFRGLVTSVATCCSVALSHAARAACPPNER